MIMEVHALCACVLSSISIVLNTIDTQTQRRLLAEADLTLQRAQEIAQGSEQRSCRTMGVEQNSGSSSYNHYCRKEEITLSLWKHTSNTGKVFLQNVTTVVNKAT